MFFKPGHKIAMPAVVLGLCLGFAAAAFSGSAVYRYDDLNRLQGVEYGDGTVIMYNYDEVGNRIGHMQFNKNSTSLPAGMVSINGGADYARSPTVNLSTLCAAASGDCADMQFSNDNTNWSVIENCLPGKAWTLPVGDGTKTVYAKFKDGAGKASSVVSDTILLDQKAPVTTASSGGVFITTITVGLVCADGSGAGCDRIYYTTDGSTPTASSKTYSGPFTFSATTTLKYFALDLVGNVEAVKTQVYKQGDLDSDGLPDSWEVAYGFDPNDTDTDNDGIADGVEDSDNDGLSNIDEYRFGTNPLLADTDNDGISDNNEYIGSNMVPIINYLLSN